MWPYPGPRSTYSDFPKIRGTFLGLLRIYYDKDYSDYSMLGSIFGSPYLGKLPFRVS